jgi:hypothetical protein
VHTWQSHSEDVGGQSVGRQLTANELTAPPPQLGTPGADVVTVISAGVSLGAPTQVNTGVAEAGLSNVPMAGLTVHA